MKEKDILYNIGGNKNKCFALVEVLYAVKKSTKDPKKVRAIDNFIKKIRATC